MADPLSQGTLMTHPSTSIGSYSRKYQGPMYVLPAHLGDHLSGPHICLSLVLGVCSAWAQDRSEGPQSQCPKSCSQYWDVTGTAGQTPQLPHPQWDRVWGVLSIASHQGCAPVPTAGICLSMGPLLAFPTRVCLSHCPTPLLCSPSSLPE